MYLCIIYTIFFFKYFLKNIINFVLKKTCFINPLRTNRCCYIANGWASDLSLFRVSSFYITIQTQSSSEATALLILLTKPYFVREMKANGMFYVLKTASLQWRYLSENQWTLMFVNKTTVLNNWLYLSGLVIERLKAAIYWQDLCWRLWNPI